MTDSNSHDLDSRPSPLLGREALLRLLETRLQSDHQLVIGVDSALRSEVGVGRTQLAEELARRITPDQSHVYRLHADCEEHWITSLQQLAQSIQTRQTTFRRRNDLYLAIRDRLSRTEHWTLLIDPFDMKVGDLDVFRGLRSGKVIVVTSPANQQLPEDWPVPVPLGGLGSDDAVRVLWQAIGAHPPQSDDPRILSSLAHQLDRNPLCLELVGRMIAEYHLLIPSVLRELAEDHSEDVLQRTLKAVTNRLSPQARVLLATLVAWGPDGFEAPNATVFTPVHSNQLEDFSQLRRLGLIQVVDRHGLLNLMGREAISSLLSFEELTAGIVQLRSRIPKARHRDSLRELITGQEEHNPEANHNGVVGIGRLLVSRRSVESSHRGWLIEAAQAAMSLMLPELAIAFLSKLLAGASNETRVTTDQVEILSTLGVACAQAEQFQQARKAWRQASDLCTEDNERSLQLQLAIAEIDVNENRMDLAAGRLLHVTEKVSVLPQTTPAVLWKGQCQFLKGALALGRGNLDKAAHRFRDALTLRSPHIPADHPQLMRNRLMLARAEFLRKNLAISESLLRDEITLREQSPCVSGNDLAIACQFLAEQYYLSGRLSDAEPLYKRVLELRRSTLSANHRQIGETANRLAVILSARGAYRESDALFREALTISEQNYGSEHPEVARLLNDLAESLIAQNKIDSARRLLERAHHVQEKSLRASDSRLGRTRCNLATVYVARGRFTEAIRLYETDLAQRKAIHVHEKAAIATTLNNLAEALRSLGRFEDAEQRLLQSLRLREELVGQEHPLVAQVLSNLGYLDSQRHRYETALGFLKRALAIREAKLSGDHPHLAATLATLADVHFQRGQYVEARPYYARAIQIALAAYGEKHPQVVTVQVSSARNELRLGHRGRAELMFLRNQATIDEVLGADHRLSAKALLGMAELAHAEKRYDMAFPWLERCLAIQRGTMSSQRLEIAETLSLITDNLSARGLWADALPRIVEAVDLQMKMLPDSHPEILPNMLRIGHIQQLLQNPSAAEEAFRHVLTHGVDTLDQTEITDVQSRLTEVLLAQTKYDQATALLLKRLEAQEAEEETPARLDLLSQLAGVYYLRSMPEDAKPIIERCVALSERQYGSESVELARHLDNLAGVQFLLGQREAAEQTLLQSLSLLERHQPLAANSLEKARGNYLQLLRETNRACQAEELGRRWMPAPREPTSSTVKVSAERESPYSGPNVSVGLPSSHVLDDL